MRRSPFSVTSGGLACVVAIVAAFPALLRYDAEEQIGVAGGLVT